MNHIDSTAPCPHTRDIERLFTGKVAPAELDEVYALIRHCPACIRRFERFARAEAALEAPSTGTPRILTNESKARIERRLLGVSEPARARTERGGWHGWAWGLTAVAGAVTLGAIALPPTSRLDGRPPDVFQARGPVPLDPAHGLRALRIRDQKGELSVKDLSDGRTLRPGDRIKIRYTELKGWTYLGIQARWPDGTVETVRASEPASSGVNRDAGPTLAVPRGMVPGPFRLVATFGASDPIELDIEAHERDDTDVAIRVIRSEVSAPRAGRP